MEDQPTPRERIELRREYLVDVSAPDARADARCRSRYIALLAQELRPDVDAAEVCERGVRVVLTASSGTASAHTTPRVLSELDAQLRERVRSLVHHFDDEEQGRRLEIVEVPYERLLREATAQSLGEAGEEFTENYLAFTREDIDFWDALKLRDKLRSNDEWREYFDAAEEARNAIPPLPSVPPRWEAEGAGIDPESEPHREQVLIPLGTEAARAAKSAKRRGSFLSAAILQQLPGRLDDVDSRLVSNLEKQRLVLTSQGSFALDVARVLLDTPRSTRGRHIDTWSRSWLPSAAFGALGLAVLALVMAWFPVDLFTGSVAVVGVVAIAIAAILYGRGQGASPRKVALGLSPAVVVWVFAVFYAAGDAVGWSVSPLLWADPLLLSLSIATWSGYLDYDVAGSVSMRVLTLAEIIAILFLVGGGLASAFTSLLKNTRERHGGESRIP